MCRCVEAERGRHEQATEAEHDHQLRVASSYFFLMQRYFIAHVSSPAGKNMKVVTPKDAQKYMDFLLPTQLLPTQQPAAVLVTKDRVSRAAEHIGLSPDQSQELWAVLVAGTSALATQPASAEAKPQNCWKAIAPYGYTIWEGATMYLASEAVRRTLASFQRRSANVLAKVGQTAEAVMSATELDWRQRQLDDEEIGVLSRLLEKKYATLQTLNLVNNQVGAEGAASLMSALEKNVTLQALNLDHNQVGDKGAASVTSALEKNDATLQTLSLGYNQVGAAGAASLAWALEKNATLQTLNLYANQVGDEGTVSLASALEKNATLQTLNLYNNQVSDEGAASLASALTKNTTLQTLNLVGNQVGAEGAASLASALEKNATLQKLYLYNNQVGDEGTVSLASALEKNATLQALNLGYNQVGAAGAASLASALEKNVTLQTLDLDGNQVSAVVLSSLASAIEKNATAAGTPP